ncbi:MAG: protein translocase subunit SecF [Chloroflexi bacterium]|nr:protein translocase subunit SecF [Chloroflexota bacterium]MBM3172801.1 protein translocase subunit SecF [Chloroflexota bacterium]MBM3175461.1 protein translocase subunit SecF [Chloroflexota bacterium]MBM4450061.1 protein translocase subunit SecF [Chloroflexota bacterium]
MIDFVGKRNLFFIISAVLIVPGLLFLAVFGLKPGVDFSSGTAITLQFDKEIEIGQLRQELDELGYDKVVIQPAGKNEYFLRLQELSTEENKKLRDGLEVGLGAVVTVRNIYTVSPVVAKGTVRNTLIAIAVASIAILLYISWAFRKMPNPFRWGTCAVIALVHDLLVVIAVFSILGQLANVEVDSLFVTGVLAVVGVSVNNIVVVFDRIRENTKRGVSKDFAVTVNCGIMESVGRSLNTGLATLFVIVALYLFGGITIQNLVLALFLGIATGIYCSLCIAGQLLVVWDRGFRKAK